MTWNVEAIAGDHRYRFINRADHSAWRVAVCRDDGDTVEIPGHVSYGGGSFDVTLQAGRYQLTWQITPSMLASRDGQPSVSATEQSGPFALPLTGASQEIGLESDSVES